MYERMNGIGTHVRGIDMERIEDLGGNRYETGGVFAL